MSRRCHICEGPTHESIYWARRDEDASTLIALPAHECTDCGALEPHAETLWRMTDDVPRDVLRRCFANERRAVPLAVSP